MPPRLVSIVAAAGYGKSTVARAYARSVSPRCAIADCAGAQTTQDLLDRLLYTLDPQVITLEGAEALTAVPDALSVLRGLFEASQTRRIVLCSRRSLPVANGLLHPHDVVALRAGDLEFDDAEIAGVLAGVKIGRERIDEIAAVTWGWAAALLFLRRCAVDGTLPEALEAVSSPLWFSFHEYAQRAVIDALSPQAREILFACVALPTLRRHDLEALYGREAAALGLHELSADLALLREGPGNGYSVHPLIAAAVAARYKEEVSTAIASLAQLYSERDPLQAAPLYLRTNDLPAASAAYEHVSVAHLERTSYKSSSEAAALDRETLINNLPLFNAAVVSDYYRIEVNDWLLQAEEALRRAPADVPLETRRITLLFMTIRYVLAGRFADGHARIEHERRLRAGDEQDELQCELMHAIVDANSDAQVDLSELRRRFAPLLGNEYFRALFARRIAMPVSALWGDWEMGQREFEIAFLQAQKRERTPFGAEIAIAACFASWLYMDAAELQRWRARLHEFDVPSLRSGIGLFLEALDGSGSIGAERFETPETRVRAYLIAASLQEDSDYALALAKRALQAAEAMGRPLFIVLARVALACIEPARTEHLRIAAEHANATPSIPLKEAVEAIEAGRADHGMLSGFMQRFARPRIPLHPELQIDVLSGEVRWNDSTVKIEQRPLQLLIFLATKGVPLRAEEIVASLWPDRTAKQMANALRVHMSALRAALSKEAVRYENERYSLGCSYTLDLQVLESQLRRVRGQVSLGGSDRRRFVSALRRLEAYTSGSVELPWLAALDSRVSEAHFENLLALARDALFAAEYPEALAYADRATRLQPWDERACEIVLRAHLQQGRRTDAVRRYRMFADELRRSLDIEPSPTLAHLVLES
jgi:DNA-binding SARP family transcriptional activator